MTQFDLKNDPIGAYYEYVNNFMTLSGFISHYGFEREEGKTLVMKGKKMEEEMSETLDQYYDVYARHVRNALYVLAGKDSKKQRGLLIALTNQLRLDSE